MVQKKESPLSSILLNIVIPSIILMKFSSEDRLGPLYALITALAFPIAYGIYDYYDRKKINFFSILGLVSTSLTGIFTLIKLPPEWIAYKEAAIPLIIGISIVGSMKTKFPLVQKILYNDAILNVEKINSLLEAGNNKAAFGKILAKTSYLLAFSFFLSAALNFALAKYLLVSEPGSEAFNEELGQMTLLSYPVIVLPSMVIMIIALFTMISGIKKLTGLTLEDVINQPPEKVKK